VNIADELQKLQQLHDSGGISDEEFAQAKAKLLATPSGGLDALFGSTKDAEQQTKLWAMLLHLSQLLGLVVVPVAGLIVPILIWQLQKEKLPGIDEHGKVVANWMISLFLYGVLCFLLAFAIVGIPLAVILGVLAIAFPIIGGVKANNGELWKYPLSISFFK
jgi:uncharacterized Tic20 family protein